MSSINKRVFGTPIKGLVKDKLEARQGETKALQPNQPLYGKTISVSNYDYASRLPFVRMWTSVKLISEADVQVIATYKASDFTNNDDFNDLDLEEKLIYIKNKAIDTYKQVKISEDKAKV